MPFCDVSKYRDGGGGNNNGTKIFYKTYGHGTTKVLLIIGLAGTHESWGPQIKGLTGVETPNNAESKATAQKLNDLEEGSDGDDNEGIEVCSFDNRGMGRSSVPTKRSEYSTTIMAKDAIALLDHLGWSKAHVFGHSMGSMIACKLAAMVSERVLSLALLNATGGGFECFPKLDKQTLSIAIRFLRAKTPEQRATVDLDTHYTKEYLDEYVGTKTRREILYPEYVKCLSSTGIQSNYGFEGQINACWTHKMTPKELEVIRSAGFPISVIHGRHDIIAQMYHARKLVEKLQPMARMIDLQGGHLVSHERPEEVNKALLELINASEMKLNPSDWSSLSKTSTGCQTEEMQILIQSNTEGSICSLFMFDILANFHLCLLYLFGVFMTALECGRKALRSLKPVRVGTSPT